MEEQPKNIHQRMLAVMEQVGFVAKDKKVKDKSGKEMYSVTSHDSVVRVLRKEILAQGIICEPTILSWKQDGNRTEIDLEIAWVNADKPEERIKGTFLGFGIDNQDKGPGKAMSYAKRYAMLMTFLLETGEDPEDDDIDHKTNKDKKVKLEKEQFGEAGGSDDVPLDTGVRKITEKQQKLLFVKSKQAGWTDEELKKWLKKEYDIEHSNEIPFDKFNKILEYVQ